MIIFWRNVRLHDQSFCVMASFRLWSPAPLWSSEAHAHISPSLCAVNLHHSPFKPSDVKQWMGLCFCLIGVWKVNSLELHVGIHFCSVCLRTFRAISVLCPLFSFYDILWSFCVSFTCFNFPLLLMSLVPLCVLLITQVSFLHLCVASLSHIWMFLYLILIVLSVYVPEIVPLIFVSFHGHFELVWVSCGPLI